MAKKKLAAIVKIQIPAGQATPGAAGRVPRSARTASTSWTSARRTTPRPRTSAGMVIPAEISIYEDRSFTFVTKTPPTPFLLRQAAGHREGRGEPAHRQGGHGHAARRCARSPRRRCPTSTPSTSKARWPRSPAPPARWASRSSTERRHCTPAGGGPRRRTPGTPREPRRRRSMTKHGKKYTDAHAPLRPRAAATRRPRRSSS